MPHPPPLRWLSTHERALRRRRTLTRGLIISTLFLILSLLDRTIWAAALHTGDNLTRLRLEDWFQSLRQFGFLPVWAIVALMLALADRAAKRPRWAARATLLFASAALGGLFAEAILGTLCRQRPGEDGLYWFSWLSPHFSRGPGHGFPSSHVAVAFGAAWMLLRLFPAAGPVALLMAAGCASTRIMAGAHFATDAFGGIIVGWLAAALLWHIHVRASLTAQSPSPPALPYACR